MQTQGTSQRRPVMDGFKDGVGDHHRKNVITHPPREKSRQGTETRLGIPQCVSPSLITNAGVLKKNDEEKSFGEFSTTK